VRARQQNSSPRRKTHHAIAISRNPANGRGHRRFEALRHRDNGIARIAHAPHHGALRGLDPLIKLGLP
jgi:hypothetical protein